MSVVTMVRCSAFLIFRKYNLKEWFYQNLIKVVCVTHGILSPCSPTPITCRVEDKGTLYPKINYCLPLSWVLPALVSYVSNGELLHMRQLEDWGQKVKHLWQLQSNLGMHISPTKSKL